VRHGTQSWTSQVSTGRVARQVNWQVQAVLPALFRLSNRRLIRTHISTLTYWSRVLSTNLSVIVADGTSVARRRALPKRGCTRGAGPGLGLPRLSYPVGKDEMTAVPPKSAGKRAGMDTLFVGTRHLIPPPHWSLVFYALEYYSRSSLQSPPPLSLVPPALLSLSSPLPPPQKVTFARVVSLSWFGRWGPGLCCCRSRARSRRGAPPDLSRHRCGLLRPPVRGSCPSRPRCLCFLVWRAGIPSA
jgi:hypothetical protein